MRKAVATIVLIVAALCATFGTAACAPAPAAGSGAAWAAAH